MAAKETRILMIEDDSRLAEMMRAYLKAAGFHVAVSDNAASGLRHLEQQSYDLVLLDLMLPDADGFDVCRDIRGRNASLPIIMVTARGDTTDRIVGLEIGADDYVPKPFEPRELLARIRAVLRRKGSSNAADVMRFGRLEIDRAGRSVRIEGELRALTARQFDILICLAERAGRVLSRDQIVSLVGADGGDSLDRAVDVHIAKIRASIEDDPPQPRRVITVRGAGYVFAQAQD